MLFVRVILFVFSLDFQSFLQIDILSGLLDKACDIVAFVDVYQAEFLEVDVGIVVKIYQFVDILVVFKDH